MAKWDMPESLAKSLEQVLSHEYVNLRVLTDDQAAMRPSGADSWSRKEELGHLIDSAGKLWSCGRDTNGQVGNGKIEKAQHKPTVVLSGVTDVSGTGVGNVAALTG